MSHRRRLAEVVGIERRRDSWVFAFCAVTAVLSAVLLRAAIG